MVHCMYINYLYSLHHETPITLIGDEKEKMKEENSSAVSCIKRASIIQGVRAPAPHNDATANTNTPCTYKYRSTLLSENQHKK
jgi:hypothetical protein